MTSPATTEAIAWLAGRLRWERLLADIHDRAERDGGPVDLDAVDLDAVDLDERAA